jgi:hypothetical protein
MSRFGALSKRGFESRPHADPMEQSTVPSVDASSAAHYLVDVIQRLSLAASLDEIVAIVRTAARQLTGADGATFVLRDGDFCSYMEGATFPAGNVHQRLGDELRRICDHLQRVS